MKYVTKVLTFDGKIHDSEYKARHYLDVMYSDSMSKVAAKLCQHSNGNYNKTKEWLDENLAIFADLAIIKKPIWNYYRRIKTNEISLNKTSNPGVNV